MAAKTITVQGFLSEFVRQDKNMPDRPFCWILGSGASVQSGIPTGGKLAMDWLKELHELEDFQNQPLEKWATEKNLGIKGFKFESAANFYPWIYQRRFHDDPDAGYAFLEKAMDAAEPSYGYSVLAQIMAGTTHKAAITTNFDNLIADALAIYTDAFPLVCGHESLTGYIRAKLRRPLVAKIHRDLLLNPLSEPGEIAKLSDGWECALKLILNSYMPIVIGYGGNDGSLMGFLKMIEPLNGGIYWCHRAGKEPGKEICEVVEKHHGRLVPIAGFDELMLQLWEKLKLESPIKLATAAHEKRVREFQNQFEALNKKLKEPAGDKAAEAARAPVREAAAAAVERLTKEKDWWAWQLKADAEPNPKEREKIFRDGLKDFPESAELTGTFALFMTNVRKNYDEAERLYRKALDLDPKDAPNNGNFGNFMKNVRKDNDAAEQFYRKALELDPTNVHSMGSLANFMTDVRKDYELAEQLYRKALALDPKHATNTGNFGNFMMNVRKDYDAAEQLYRKALELDPNHAHHTGNLANFMEQVRKDYDEAERLFRKAIDLDPNNSLRIANLASFMERIRKDNNAAEQLYRSALKIDPKDAITIGNFASFSWEIRKDFDAAEQLYRKSLQLDPKFAGHTANFAEFMEKARKSFTEANRLYRLALELDPNLEFAKSEFARFLKEHPEFGK
jgi:Tfp pilus assembly protein PilF